MSNSRYQTHRSYKHENVIGIVPLGKCLHYENRNSTIVVIIELFEIPSDCSLFDYDDRNQILTHTTRGFSEFEFILLLGSGDKGRGSYKGDHRVR